MLLFKIKKLIVQKAIGNLIKLYSFLLNTKGELIYNLANHLIINKTKVQVKIIYYKQIKITYFYNSQ